MSSQPFVTENVDGGLVTSKDPATLAPGELSACDNAVYKPNSASLHRAPGHTLFGTVVAGSAINGLTDIKFDNGNHYLVAEVSGARYRSPVTDTGTWTSMDTGLASGGTLQKIQYQNQFFFLNGSNADRVAYLTATAVANTPTFRAMGMQPVTVTPDAVTAAGVWSATATGWYEYWTTEVYEFTKDGSTARLEGTYGANPFDPAAFTVDPRSVQVTAAATQAVRITRPVPAGAASFNSTATYWRVYRSPKKENETDTWFPTGYLIAELPVSTESFLDGVAATATANCTTATNVAGWDASAGSLAASVTSSNNVYAQVTAGTFNNVLRCHGFTTYSTAPSDPIAGIEVLVEAKASVGGLSKLAVALTNDGGTTITPYKQVQLTTSDVVYTLGSPSDLWDFPWTAAQVTSTNFGVMLRASFFSDNVSVDHVRVRVNFNGTPTTSAEVFPAVIIDVGGEQSAVGSHGPPPTSSTGDIFEDALVVNDVDFPSLIRWSLPSEVEYFPWLYFYDFETDANDQVTCVKTLGNRLVVGLRGSIWRMNYLPNEDDARFSRGKAIDLISPNDGIVNAKAAVLFTGAGGRVELCFVGASGVFVTDGFNIREAAPDIKWSTAFGSIDYFDAANLFLENDPLNWEIRLHVLKDESKGLVYRLNYHPSHIKNGGYMKVSGPHHMYHTTDDVTYGSPRSSVSVTKTDGTVVTYFGYSGTDALGGGRVYRQIGTNVPFSNLLGLYTAAIKTRQMYLAGTGNEFTLNDVYVHHQHPSDALIQVYTDTSRTGEAETVDDAGLPFNINFVGNSKVQPMKLAEAVRIHIADDSGSPTTINDWSIDYLALAGVGFERQTSG